MALFIPTAAMGPTTATASLHASPFGMDATSTAVLTEHLIESTTNWIHHQQQQQQQQQQHQQQQQQQQQQSLPGASYHFNSLHQGPHRHISRHNPLHASSHLHHHRQLHHSRQARRLSQQHSLLQSNQSHHSNSLSTDPIVQLVNPSNVPLALLVTNSGIETSVHQDLPSSSPSSVSSCSSPSDGQGNNVLAVSRMDACIHLPNNSHSSGREGTSGGRKSEFVDVHKGKPIRLKVKVLIPVDDHPNFNFVGKLLGPKGQSLKWLQEQTQTKMTILGKGSMRDKQKEEELRSDSDPKYHHLRQDLHVEITAFAPAHEAYSRIGHALQQIKRFLVPDYYDEIRQQQLKELGIILPDRKGVSSTCNNNISIQQSSSSSVDVTASPAAAASVQGGTIESCSLSACVSSDANLHLANASTAVVTCNSLPANNELNVKNVDTNGTVVAISHQEQHPHLHAHHHHHHQDHLCHHHESHAHFLANQAKCTFATASSTSASTSTSTSTSTCISSEHNSQSSFICPCKESLKRQDSLPASPNSYSSSPTSSTCNSSSFDLTTVSSLSSSSCPASSNCTPSSTIPLMTKHYDSNSDSPSERQRPCQPLLC